MSDVASAEEVKRSKRQAGDADSDSYEEYKSDEEGRGAVEEEDTLKNEEEKVKIISVVQTDDQVVDGISEKETGDKKKDKKKKEKRSKHDKEGAENGDGQDRKERKKEKKSKEGKKEKKPKEHRDKEKTDDVKTEKVEEEKKVVTFEEVPQKEEPTTVVKIIEEVSPKKEPTTVEKPHEKAEESKPAEATAVAAAPEAPQENPPSVAPVSEKVKDEAAPVAHTEAAPPKQKEEEKAEHPVATTEVTTTTVPLPDTKEEKTEVPVVLAGVAPPSEPVVSEKKEDVVHPETAPSEAAATISTLSETATVSASESQPVAVSQPPVADSNPPEPSPPSTDAVVTETGDHLPRKTDTSDQENVSTADKKEEPQGAPLTGVQKILEHARKEAEVRATGSSKLLMARNLVSRQEKLQEQLTNMRHEFGDIDSEIRALKIDCYRNQRAYPKHQ